MSKEIDLISAKSKIKKMFPNAESIIELYQNYSEGEYIKNLNIIKQHIPLKKEKHNLNIIYFCYAGCLKFDRFNAPTPFVVNPEQNIYFKMFVDALIKAEGGTFTHNSLAFTLKHIRSNIYTEFDSKPLNEIDIDKVVEFQNKLKNFAAPLEPIKLIEFEDEKNKINSILDGILDKSLITKITTRIPYIIYRSSLSLTFQWQGIELSMFLKPVFSASTFSFANFDQAAQPASPSRWQTGHTEIEIQFSALIDCDIYAKPIQAIYDKDLPFKGWPKCFVITFDVITDVIWKLRLDNKSENTFFPAPTDIGFIKWEIFSNHDSVVDWKIKDSPANMWFAFSPSNDIQTMSLGDVKPPSWSEKCKYMAIMYFEIGQNEEAIFWINVGVEALFEERFELISRQIKNSEFIKELNKPKVFWEGAEEIIADQFPDIAGKIKWPDTKIHISIFAKLKYLFKNVAMKTTVKELLSNYSTVNKIRNNLFHGKANVAITVDDVKEAIASFKWIADNFYIASEIVD